MRVGIIGSGDVGRRLGQRFLSRGYEVMIGSRTADSEKLAKWREENGNRASTGTFAEAAAFGELLVLATLWSGTENAIRLPSHKTLPESF